MSTPEDVNAIYKTLEEQLVAVKAALDGFFENADGDAPGLTLIECVAGMRLSLEVLEQLVDNPTPQKSVMLTGSGTQMGYFLDRVRDFCQTAEQCKAGRVNTRNLAWRSIYVNHQLGFAVSETVNASPRSSSQEPSSS